MKRRIYLGLNRRRFLELLAAFGLISATSPLLSCAESGGEKDPPEVLYRFQNRGARVCRACKNHRRYKAFLDEATADQRRAHKGCNCRIVTQSITEEYWDTIKHYEQDGVIDLRAIYG